MTAECQSSGPQAMYVYVCTYAYVYLCIHTHIAMSFIYILVNWDTRIGSSFTCITDFLFLFTSLSFL